jgi:hypothetical protein
MFVVGEGGNLELLTRGPAPKHLVPVYGQASYLPHQFIYIRRGCSGLNPYTGSYHCAAKTTHGLLIRAHIFQPSAGTSGSSASGASLDHDSTDDYPETGGSTCWNSAEESHPIIMMAPTEAPSQNSSNIYSSIRRSEAPDVQTPSDRLV